MRSHTDPHLQSINQKIIQFSRNTTNDLLPIYKSFNMFRLIAPSLGQFTNHTEGTFSSCAQWFVNWPVDGFNGSIALLYISSD